MILWAFGLAGPWALGFRLWASAAIPSTGSLRAPIAVTLLLTAQRDSGWRC